MGFFYFVSLYVGMEEVIRDPSVHDCFPMTISESTTDFLKLITTLILVLNFIYRGLHLGDNAPIYFKRWSLMYFLKGVMWTITIIPASDGTDQRSTRSLAKMMQMGNCADMMFSGHTAITYLTCPRKYRFIIVPIMMSPLVITNAHYTGDVIMALITARLIEYELPLKKKGTQPIPEDSDGQERTVRDQVSSLIDDSMDVNSHQRILVTDSDREEDLECY
jgi:hypothetical protein